MYREQRMAVFQRLFARAVNYYFSRGKIIGERWQSLVECTGLENRSALTGTVGSNPTLSVIFFCWRQKITYWENNIIYREQSPAVLQC